MTVEGRGYALWLPGPVRSEELPRAQARAAYDAFLESRVSRIEMLRDLVARDGVELSDDDGHVQELNDWFLAGVEPDSERPGRLPPFWFSVAHDIAVFLGELAIARHSNLSWEFFVWGKKNVAYQRPVIMGFAGEDPKYRTNADPEASVLSYAHATIAARGSRREHGTVNVRGVSLDIDSLLGSPRPPQTDEFVRWLAIIDRRNAEHPGAR